MSSYLHQLHVELWQWLADNPGKYKQDWPGWRTTDLVVQIVRNTSHCFACYAAGLGRSIRERRIQGCQCCPCDWTLYTEGGTPESNDLGYKCMSYQSSFSMWNSAVRKGDKLSAAVYASRVRDAWRDDKQ